MDLAKLGKGCQVLPSLVSLKVGWEDRKGIWFARDIFSARPQ